MSMSLESVVSEYLASQWKNKSIKEIEVEAEEWAGDKEEIMREVKKQRLDSDNLSATAGLQHAEMLDVVAPEGSVTPTFRYNRKQRRAEMKILKRMKKRMDRMDTIPEKIKKEYYFRLNKINQKNG